MDDSPLTDRLARAVAVELSEADAFDGLSPRERRYLETYIAAAIRAALDEAAAVARHPKWTDDSDSYVQTAANEIAAAIEALKGPA